MSTNHDREPVGSQTPRLVVSWLIVGLPLVYGVYQTISKTLPLFGG
ncbi:MAG: MFS transporter small subunit [Geodermatophilaceae bacterium]